MAEQLNWRDLIAAADETPEETLAALDAYFEPFAALPGAVGDDGRFKIEDGQPCLNCGEKLMGDLTDQLFGKGGFEWGIAHGEGHCSNCRWPARLYHFIKDADGNDLMTLRSVCLQYHPDFVEKRKSA